MKQGEAFGVRAACCRFLLASLLAEMPRDFLRLIEVID